MAANGDGSARARECDHQATAAELLHVAFVMEQHLGHRTYYENLKSNIDERDVLASWVPIDYSADRGLARLPLPSSVKSALAGRGQVRRGIKSSGAECYVFNTQVPAVLGGRTARCRPYIVISDVTPKQYDRIASGYGHRADRPGPVARLKDRLNRRTLTEAAWCVGWSEWTRSSFVDEYGVPAGRTSVIPPGVDTTVWGPGLERDDGTFRILFVGGDFERKGGDRLLQAFRSLPVESELVVVTRSPVSSSERVTVVNDMVPNDPRLIDLFRRCDVFAFPTEAETFGIAAVEAAASGLPVVASDVGGLGDIVEDGVSGYLLQDDRVSELVATLSALQRDQAARRRMGVAARQRAVTRFDAATNARSLLDLIARECECVGSRSRTADPR